MLRNVPVTQNSNVLMYALEYIVQHFFLTCANKKHLSVKIVSISFMEIQLLHICLYNAYYGLLEYVIIMHVLSISLSLIILVV